MVKRIIFRILDTAIFTAAAFFICYAFLLPRLNSKNAALFSSVFVTLALSYAYFILRGIFIERKDARLAETEQIRDRYYNFLLMPQYELNKLLAEVFGISDNGAGYRQKENIIIFSSDKQEKTTVQNNQKEANKEKQTASCTKQVLICMRPPENRPISCESLLRSLRLIGNISYSKLIIIAPFGLDGEATALLNRIGAKYELLKFTGLLKRCEQKKIDIRPLQQENSSQRLKFSQRLTPLLENKRSFKVLVKYALFLCLLSVFTPLYLYYWIVAAIFLGAGTYIKFRQRAQSKNIF